MLPFIKRRRERVHQTPLSGRLPYHYPEDFPHGNPQPLMIIGDYASLPDAKAGEPLQGDAGALLDTWIAHGGFERESLLLANVFNMRVEKDNPRSLFRPLGFPNTKVCEDLAPHTGLYCREEFRSDIDFLKATIFSFRPEVIITLGPLALWAVTNADLSVARFTAKGEKPHFCQIIHRDKTVRFLLLPAYHPRGIVKVKGIQTEEEAVSLRAFKQAQKIMRPASL